MNVLILTPDRVGSTLLQRVLTVYANINENYNPLTINLHELTNGIRQYHNEQFNQNLLGRFNNNTPANQKFKPLYWQTLPTIVDLLSNRTHDVTARVAHYHIKNRNDTIAEQLEFYQYLNENFYIISCRRKNLFEHAMSWSIVGRSKTLNVYSFKEKHSKFKEIHENGIAVQQEVMEKYLQQYHEYLDWTDRHFNVNSYFEYERDLPNIENFLLNLDVFRKFKKPLTWQDKFDIDWSVWNRMHYLLSLILFDYEFNLEEKEFMKNNFKLYHNCRTYIQELQNNGIMISGIPIKLHTLKEKSNLISNIDQCLIGYNNWVNNYRPSYAIAYHPETMTQVAQLEHQSWMTGIHYDTGTLLSNNITANSQLGNQSNSISN